MKVDPDFADWKGYVEGRYTRGREFQQLAQVDPWWLTLGGSVVDPFGFGEEIVRQREEANNFAKLDPLRNI